MRQFIPASSFATAVQGKVGYRNPGYDLFMALAGTTIVDGNGMALVSFRRVKLNGPGNDPYITVAIPMNGFVGRLWVNWHVSVRNNRDIPYMGSYRYECQLRDKNGTLEAINAVSINDRVDYFSGMGSGTGTSSVPFLESVMCSVPLSPGACQFQCILSLDDISYVYHYFDFLRCYAYVTQ